MKKAIGYIRISTKDQSNFSISGQVRSITEYCERSGVELVATFTDDGKSAKSFDRPDWQKLEEFVKKNYKDVDSLIVLKFDRFSRNTMEALQMIEKLEERYSIRVISVMEPIALHPKSPFYFKFRADILVNAQVELMTIRERTRFGIYIANKNGRWVNNAPFGYLNGRDTQNKPILLVDEVKSIYVKKIFALYLSGCTIEATRKAIAKEGCKVKGNSSIQRMLLNPVYAGFVKVLAYYDEPEKLVPGIHEPLITKEDWWKTQAILSASKNRSHLSINETVPLRGALRCHCSKLLTAGNSRSKTGRYYWYYSCSENDHRKSLRADKLHAQFEEILTVLSDFPPHYIKYMEDRAIEKIMASMKAVYDESNSYQLQLRQLSGKIESLEEKYIANDIDKATYDKWLIRYSNDKTTIASALAMLELPLETRMSHTKEQLANLNNLVWLFNKATVAQKHAIIRFGFDNRLYYQDSVYRTPYLHHIFSSKAVILKEKGLLILEQPGEKLVQLGTSSRYGNRTRLCPVKGGCPNR